MIEIIPALMPKDFSELSNYTKMFKGVVRSVQIDVMDGKFVPDTSWPYVKDGSLDDKFMDIVARDEKLPDSEDLGFELDLMIGTPEKTIKSWLHTGANRLVFHLESIKDIDWFWRSLAFVSSPIPELGEPGIEIGLAINTTTPNEDIYPYVEKIDFLQFMGIEKIGFQGQFFDERVLDKIADLREKFPSTVISVDGSVNMETAPKLIEAGATRLVVGSAILESDDIVKAVKELQGL